jgi:hypothetical protein
MDYQALLPPLGPTTQSKKGLEKSARTQQNSRRNNRMMAIRYKVYQIY